jgi:predicted ArsR family transcriptional regulator
MGRMLDTIASRSRLAVLRRLDAAPNSSAPELAAATGLHLNTVRAHLRALESAGIAERETKPAGGPGRPTVRYRLRRSILPDGEELLPLSALLAGALTGFGPEALAASRAQGEDWGREWGRRCSGEGPAQCACSALERLGFAVALEADHMRMSNCPCPLVATSKPQLICGLADAVVDGVLERTSLRAVHHAHDPAARVCTITLAPA